MRTSMITITGFVDLFRFVGLGPGDGPVNSHSSIRSSAEIRENFSDFSSSSAIGSIDCFRRKTVTVRYVTLISIYLMNMSKRVSYGRNKMETIKKASAYSTQHVNS